MAAPRRTVLRQVMELKAGEREILYVIYYEGFSTLGDGVSAGDQPDGGHHPPPAGQKEAEGTAGRGGAAMKQEISSRLGADLPFRRGKGADHQCAGTEGARAETA